MKTLVIGTGGREHALALALSRESNVSEVHAAPGNPGIAAFATCHPVDQLNGEAVADLAVKLGVDLVVVGPEAPLVAGVADAIRGAGIACFGPSKAAAQIEGSKAFAKQIMASADVPTAMSRVCETKAQVKDALDMFGPPYVVKDDALAAGKGVVVTEDRKAAIKHAQSCGRVVIEEYLAGPEISLFAITDGSTVLPLQPAQDFKRAHDNDEGPNTGGMGAYTPLAWAPDNLVADVSKRVLVPTIREMAAQGAPFQGLLYAGLVLTDRGVKVIEFNARFGDPETQALLALLKTPLSALLMGSAQGTLADVGMPVWRDGAAVTVVVASKGYPEKPRTGDVICGLDKADALEKVDVIHAGTALDADRNVVTAGGRVLSVTARGSSLAKARERAYSAVDLIDIKGAFHRTDIAEKAAAQAEA